MTKFWYLIIAFLLLVFVFDDIWKDEPGLEFMKNTEERLNCEEGIGNIAEADLVESEKVFKIVEIKSNIVEFPLNKKEVMVEYCITVANLASDMRSIDLWVRLVDKDDNVLAEEDEYVFDIPGRRTKNISGSIFVGAQLAEEITNVRVSGRR